MAERLADQSRPSAEATRFFFELADPISYVTAERIERALGSIEWVPVLAVVTDHYGAEAWAQRELRIRERLRVAAYDAESLQIPLIEPHRCPTSTRKAARAALYASDHGAGAAFALAAFRLAFCGGFDLADMEVIVEAAAVARIDPAAAIAAAYDRRYDRRLDATTQGLQRRGIGSAPAISVGAKWFGGSDAVVRAVLYAAKDA